MGSPRPQIRAATAGPAKLSLVATASIDLAAAAEGEPAKLPRFEITGYTGSVMSVAGFYNPVIVDLTGLRANGGHIPALLNHDFEQVVGQTDAISITGEGVTLSGVITGDDAAAKKVVTHARNGFRWQASIGADVVRQEYLKPGEKATVNGREVSGPLLIAREAKLREISFTPLGADDRTTASVAASQTLGLHSGANAMTFEQWLEAKGFDPAALSDSQRAALQAGFNAEHGGGGNGKADPHEERAAATLDSIVARHEAEMERQQKILAMIDDAIANRPALIAEFRKLGEVAIESKSPINEVELQVMRLERKRGYGVVVRGGRRLGQNLIEATVCRSLGIPDLEKHFDEDTLNASDDQYPRGIRLGELLLLGARENGYSGHTINDTRDVLRAAFDTQGRTAIRANDGFSTLSLPKMFANVANKFLLMGFNSVESSWRQITSIRSAADYKTMYSYNFTADTVYKKVPPGGEIKHATAGELEYTNRVEMYGRMFALTEQDIVNDDLGVLAQIPRKLGRGAALALNLTFWTEFLANVSTFYTTARGNYNTGADSVLGFDGLTNAELLFALQTDPDGNPLGVEPAILVVPTALRMTATDLMGSQFVNTGGAATDARVGNTNVWYQRFRVVSSSYLQNSSITGNSATAWYLLADPNDLPVMEVAFLNGRQEPRVESAEADFNVVGIQYRGIYSFGVAKQEYRGAVRSAGA